MFCLLLLLGQTKQDMIHLFTHLAWELKNREIPCLKVKVIR
jgi:hypothetical protein